ncbi:adhesion G-protein coupled receptor D2 isoform X1 [Coturnix japonica]|uniref:Adhesion G protein-coupled receptor D2 n=1 Tax=Coturnix japonica TaxID=93934 RepID=A0A8C2TK28_COTJA|nr:adhesion G-protein coupled receptor D2 isoform X1 [Coturnix japonica]XP_015734912.1 adhesion G-protein coupled receptor D2 isoform X1 [Coturnix japonica]XP_015734913.1 adhesion G-protein coupled receptor D2 isoform X1 [Coturnix japonica]
MRDLRPDSWFFSFLVGSLSRTLFTSAALAENQTSKDFVPVMIETLRHVYEYVPTALDWWHADRFCDQRFAQLLFEPPDSEQSSFSKLLQSHHIRGSVWLNERDGVLHKPKWRRNHIVPVLVFGDKTDTKYVKVLSDFPVLPAVTACAHLQWDTRTQEIATVFSYAVPAFINEFQLRGFVDEEGFVRFALIVHGHHSPYLPMFRADGQWHHFCVTWQQENGTWAIYADGKRRASASGLYAVGLAAPQAIYGQGTFIIGQDQDSLGGTFKAKESFSGNITDLHIWQKVLSVEQIENVRSCWMVEQELVFGWSLNALEIESTVEEVIAQFLCPGPVEECQVFEVGSSGFRHTSCLQSLPFICRYRKDAYWQLKKAQLESSHLLVSHVNTLAKRMMIPENIFTSNVRDMNLSVALGTLDVLATVLRKEETPVESSDLLMVLQLLKQVADVEVQEREELEMLEQLGQYYVEVTELILEEQNIESWSSISQAVRGPMAVVELCDRVVSLLAPLLNSGRTKITIQHQNVGMEVRKLELSSQQLSTETYLIQSPEEDRPDFIEIPVEEMQRLKAKGLRRVTVKNMWFGYGSLQRCLPGPGSSAAFQDEAASDGGQKYLSTAVGTAVISSTVLSDYQEISTSVRYRLQHHSQDLPDKLVGPICAFWNFSLSPEAGGMWSTAGCSVVTSLPDSTVCFCNHTTNFAVLLQMYEIERTTKEELTLQTLTFIGCGVSFCALVVTFILFLVVGVPKSERTTVHKNLIFALAAAEALLMFSEVAKTNQVLCFLVTAFLHLLFMAAFSWMLVEGLLLWSKVVAVNMSEDRRMKFYYATGWGLPSIIVGVTLATSFNNYVADNHCWLNVQTNVIWAFVGPVLFILAVNTFVLFRVVMVTVSSARRRAKMLTPNSSLENQIGIQIWATAKPILVLLPVLGLTWVCGILVHLSIVWAYVFIMLNSLQGLYIFLVYAIYNSEVRNAIQRMKDKKKALSFTNCSHPINYLSSPRNTTSWETGKPSPAVESAPSNPVQKDPPMKNITSRGNFGGKIPMGISSVMSPERPAVELTAFKSSVSKQGKLRLFSRRCHPEALQLSSPQWTHERGRQRCLGGNVLQSQAQHCAH